jgi:patatin-like phospholipase/acyl hydrolase
MEFNGMSDTTVGRFRILALNGGGVRGLYTISVLAELERILAEREGKPDLSIASYFDLITGSSIGGILALALSDGHNARSLKEKFMFHAPAIFPEDKWKIKSIGKIVRLYRLLAKTLYSPEPLKNCVEDILGRDRKIRDLERRILIPTVNLTTGRPLYVKTCHDPSFTRDDKFYLVDVGMATSAAPTYFPPHYIDSESAYFADGGLLANNPSFVAYHEALTYIGRGELAGLKSEQIFILNIGTLSNSFCIDPRKIKNVFHGYIGLWGGGKDLIDTVMASNQLMHGYMAKRALGHNKNIFEIDDIVPDQQSSLISLDNANHEALKVLVGRGNSSATVFTGNTIAMQTFFDVPAPKFIHPAARGVQV